MHFYKPIPFKIVSILCVFFKNSITLTASKPPLFTRDFILHCISYFFLASSFYFLLPTLPIYVVEYLGEDKSKVGYVIGIYALAALITRPFGGYALDKYGRRGVFLISLLAFTLVMAGYLFAASFFSLMVVRMLHGISWANITTGAGTITADIVPEKRRGEGIGYFGLSMTLSMAFGPLIGLYIMGENDFTKLFASALVLGLIATVVSFFVKYEDIRKPATRLRLDNMFEKNVFQISFVMLMLAIPFASIMTYVTLYAKEIGIENGGSFFLIYAFGVSIVRPFAGKVMDNLGPAMLMVVSFAATTGGMLMLGFADSPKFFLSAAFITGIGNGIVMPTINTMVINMVPAYRRGVANSTFFSSIDIGIGLGSILLGYIADMSSLREMFIYCGLFMLFPLLYFFTFALKDYKQKTAISIQN